MSDSESAGLDLSRRLNYLRSFTKVHSIPSADSSVNNDSLLYLAKFATGKETRLFPVSGAMKTLGATPAQSLKIIDLLCEVVSDEFDENNFPAQVSQRLGISVTKQRIFPAVSTLTPEQQLAASEDFQKHRAEQSKREHQRARETAELELAVAEILRVDVQSRESEWSLERVDDGTLFNPVSDFSLALQLVVAAKLDITHQSDDIMITFRFPNGQQVPILFFSSDFNHSLPRTICAAAVRRAQLLGESGD